MPPLANLAIRWLFTTGSAPREGLRHYRRWRAKNASARPAVCVCIASRSTAGASMHRRKGGAPAFYAVREKHVVPGIDRQLGMWDMRGVGGTKRLVAVGQCLGLGAQIAELGWRLACPVRVGQGRELPEMSQQGESPGDRDHRIAAEREVGGTDPRRIDPRYEGRVGKHAVDDRAQIARPLPPQRKTGDRIAVDHIVATHNARAAFGCGLIGAQSKDVFSLRCHKSPRSRY